MKNRKKVTQIKIENRNAKYRKANMYNRDLAEKNTELSQRINTLEQYNKLLRMNGYRFILYQIKTLINYIKKLYYEITNRNARKN